MAIIPNEHELFNDVERSPQADEFNDELLQPDKSLLTDPLGGRPAPDPSNSND